MEKIIFYRTSGVCDVRTDHIDVVNTSLLTTESLNFAYNEHLVLVLQNEYMRANKKGIDEAKEIFDIAINNKNTITQKAILNLLQEKFKDEK